jgi:hypothetical protein
MRILALALALLALSIEQPVSYLFQDTQLV